MLTWPALPLYRYAQRIGYTECAFFGVAHPDNPRYACREVWSYGERQMLADALTAAQDIMEQELRYALAPRWFAAERHRATCPVRTAWGYVQAVGVLRDTMLAEDVAVDYAADPALVVVDLGTEAVADVHLFLPDSDAEVTPSAVTVDGTWATFAVPWCRLVAEDYAANPPEGWAYADVCTWGTPSVDVRVLANDPTTMGVLEWAADPCVEPCGVVRADVCLRVHRADIGSLSWGPPTATCPSPTGAAWLEVNYRAGLDVLPAAGEDALLRLAHASMAEEPCGCEVTQRLWRRDRHAPEVFTRERLNCPFGLSDGAWAAWRWVMAHKMVRGALL